MRIGPIESRRSGEWSEVIADVDGSPLWFRARHHELRPSAEGFVSAVLVAAMHHGRPVELECGIDAAWLENSLSLMAVYTSWWDDLKAVPIEAASALPAAQRSQARALCFSGGVDSFHSLLTRSGEIDLIAYVVGYDVRLGRKDSIMSFVGKLDGIAEECGCRAVLMETNLRDHPLHAGVDWSRSHGGALAAIGHLLSGVGSLYLSASLPYAYHRPWGSHYDSDDLLSSSGMRVCHIGAGMWREQKLVAISGHPLVRSNLRVCWQKDAAGGNCCRCEKCLRTMLALKRNGVLDGFTVFADSSQLGRMVRRLPALQPLYYHMYCNFACDERLADIRPDIETLLRRTRRRYWCARLVHGGRYPGEDPFQPRKQGGKVSSAGGWDAATLRARIDSSSAQRLRHAAGSPDVHEIEAYRAAVADRPCRCLAVVLGMTPELRRMVADTFDRFLSIDVNAASIELYRDWLSDTQRERETVIQQDWMICGDGLGGTVDAVFGDGVLANIPTVGQQLDLLRHLKTLLKPDGCLILRKVVMPDAHFGERDHFDSLLRRHRCGEISDEEFGFGARILGHRDGFYDPASGILRCGEIFRSLEVMHAGGLISDREKEVLWRYYFNGDNCIVTAARWHSMVADAGFDFEILACKGRDWYRYYPVYRLTPAGSSRP